MNFQVKLIKNEQRRAVAPIIATLLMVAISVVGGILIFVFSQGFFKDTSILAPTLDALEIWGFNAKDVASTAFVIHSDTTATCASGTVDQLISEDECMAIFVRNLGANTLIIQTVRVQGTEVPFNGTGPLSSTPPAGSYCLSNAAGTCTGKQIVESGQELSLVVSNASSIAGNIKIGRPIQFVIETGQGQQFTKQVRAGLSSGI